MCPIDMDDAKEQEKACACPYTRELDMDAPLRLFGISSISAVRPPSDEHEEEEEEDDEDEDFALGLSISTSRAALDFEDHQQAQGHCR